MCIAEEENLRQQASGPIHYFVAWVGGGVLCKFTITLILRLIVGVPPGAGGGRGHVGSRRSEHGNGGERGSRRYPRPCSEWAQPDTQSEEQRPGASDERQGRTLTSWTFCIPS